MSGTFPTPAARDRYEEAHRLACAIEALLAPAEGERAPEPYGQRVTLGLVRSLIDSLQDLQRDSVRSRRLV